MSCWVVMVEAEGSHARVSSLAFESLEEAETWVMSRSDHPKKDTTPFVYWGDEYINRYELFEVRVR